MSPFEILLSWNLLNAGFFLCDFFLVLFWLLYLNFLLSTRKKMRGGEKQEPSKVCQCRLYNLSTECIWDLTRAQHSELFSEHSSRVSSRNEFLRVGTSSEKARKTCSDPNFWKIANFSYFFAKNRENREKKHWNYLNISEIWKTAISETRENKNFGKNRLTQGLRFNWSLTND